MLKRDLDSKKLIKNGNEISVVIIKPLRSAFVLNFFNINGSNNMVERTIVDEI